MWSGNSPHDRKGKRWVQWLQPDADVRRKDDISLLSSKHLLSYTPWPMTPHDTAGVQQQLNNGTWRKETSSMTLIADCHSLALYGVRPHSSPQGITILPLGGQTLECPHKSVYTCIKALAWDHTTEYHVQELPPTSVINQ